MNLSLFCPSCSRPIGTLRLLDQQVICPHCRSEFGVLYGKLSKRSSISETLLYLTSKLPRFYKRHYTLKITTPDRHLKQVQFSIPGEIDQVPVHSGDLVSVLYTMRGYVMQHLVAITNHTTGKHYLPLSPITSSSQLVVPVGTAIAAVLIAAYLSGVNLLLAGTVSIVGTLVYLKLGHTAQISSPALKTQGKEGLRLLGEQRLWQQKRKIEQRVRDIEHDSKANQLLISQLAALKQKMTDLDARLYSARIFRTTSAMKLIEQQTVNNRRLIREYHHALKMIDIEIDTSWIADQLPDGDDFIHKIIRKLEELKAIEEQNQSLKFQLAAYDELRSRGA
jgi:uncharacterized membrane protein